MLNQLHLIFHFLFCYYLHITLCLFILPIHTPSLSSISPSEFLVMSEPPLIPTIWNLSISSTNNCNPAYAVDNDRIICTFTTMNPCILVSDSIPFFSVQSDSCISSGFKKPQCLFFHPENDFRHWTCVYQIQNGDFPDQTSITARFFLEKIFHGNYRYYGPNPAVTYYAPIRYSFTLSGTNETRIIYTSGDDIQLKITSNHPIEFLPPEEFNVGSRTYWSVSIIDQAGNGPCCITISLEDNSCLLYNFRHVRDNFYIFSFISQNKG